MGSQNWTDELAPVFRDRYGYDPLPWLPVLTGRVVGSADQSDRFLWDLRRLVADRIATEYVGGLRDLCRPHGLQLWLENYGHWGFPAEFLQYGGQSDCIGGEFWLTGGLGAVECRAASSAAHTYGFPRVSAEAFTGGPLFRTVPSALKARGDWAFCEGINHFVLHVYIHQPWEDRQPGVNAWFGTEFNRHNTWFNASRDWINYLRRSCFLLQQGTRVADVAYFIGEDAPKMTGIRQPELPPGFDYDFINAEVIQTRLTVKDGLLTLPGGPAYRVLVLPEMSTMRPPLLRKIRDLVSAGATVLGPPPLRSPSMQDYPDCDREVRSLAAEIWGANETEAALQKRPTSLSALTRDFSSTAPLLYTHRTTSDAEIYFVANQQAQEIVATATFRVQGMVPELWRPESGRVERAAVYDVAEGTVRVPLHLNPHGSVFVVFRREAPGTDRIVAVRRDGETILDAKTAASREPASTPVATADEKTLMQSMLRPGVRPPGSAAELSRNPPGHVVVQAWQPGEYALVRADGKERALRVDAIPAPLNIAGPWEVQFDPHWGGPQRVEFEALRDWTQHPEEGIRYYSGAATYRKKISLPSASQGQRLWLDLGQVCDLAVVRLNGQSLGTLWLAPWRVEITHAARPGDNVLEVDVINPWHNRLMGDLSLPPDQRRTYLALPVLTPNAPLLPAGLLGPVRIESAIEIEVE
jgi:hypothetical protein